MKQKKPCIFCKGFKLNKFNLLLIVLVCFLMYWVNQYQIQQIDQKERVQESKSPNKANP